MNEEYIGNIISTGLIMYFLVLPFIYNTMWQDSNKDSYIKWYFRKSESVNWLGYLIFFILGLGSFIYVILFYITEIIFYIVVLPLIWLFEFMFLNKDCSHIVCDELKEKDYKEK